jgi:hypothetical protein
MQTTFVRYASPHEYASQVTTIRAVFHSVVRFPGFLMHAIAGGRSVSIYIVGVLKFRNGQGEPPRTRRRASRERQGQGPRYDPPPQPFWKYDVLTGSVSKGNARSNSEPETGAPACTGRRTQLCTDAGPCHVDEPVFEQHTASEGLNHMMRCSTERAAAYAYVNTIRRNESAQSGPAAPTHT